MALDVKVTIALSKVSGSVGFGNPLFLECGVENPVAYTECYSLADVVAAGYKEDSDMYKAANMIFAQDTRPSKIAICGAKEGVVEAITALESKNWRQLVLLTSETADYTNAAEFIETTKKMLYISVTNENLDTITSGFKGKSYDRTVILINDTPFAAAAVVGMASGRAAGSFTYKFKGLKNVVAEEFKDTDIDALHKNGMLCYITKAGDDQLSEGFSQSGMFIDITDSIDYVIQNIEYRIQKTFNNTAKVTYDDRGIALLEAATVTALQEAFVNGIIAVKEDGVTPDYEVYFAPRSATTEADRATREYKYGTFKFALAGAIHYCVVEGTVTY